MSFLRKLFFINKKNEVFSARSQLTIYFNDSKEVSKILFRHATATMSIYLLLACGSVYLTRKIYISCKKSKTNTDI